MNSTTNNVNRVTQIAATIVVTTLVATACSAESQDADVVTEPGIELPETDPIDPSETTTASPVSSTDVSAPDTTAIADEPVSSEPVATNPVVSEPDSTLAAIYDVGDVDLGGLADGLTIVATECEDGDGFVITHLPDVLIEPTLIEAETIPDIRIGDEVVEGVQIEREVIPGAVVDAGCIIEFDAPGGCIGAVEITPVSIPASAIPGARLPSATIGDVVLDGDEGLAAEEAGIVIEGVQTDQVCQLEVSEGETTPTVFRPTIFRETAFRPTMFRPTMFRPSANVDGERVPSASVESVSVESVSVESVSVESETLESRPPVAPEVSTIGNDEETAYLLPDDVLFDFDESVLRPGADATLTAIVAELIETYPDGAIEVGGHTDSIGTDEYNQTLSEARAQTVAQWLIANGGIDESRITTVGYGESSPVAPNEMPDGTDYTEGRQQNRRVVVSARN